MKKIYVLLMHTHTVPAKLIKQITRYKYSHVAISFDETCDITYSFGRKNVHSIIDSGFVIEHKNGDFFKKFNKTTCKIYEVEVTDKQFNKARSIIKEMEQNPDIYKYDFVGIVLRFFNLPICFKNKYVCSYFAATILNKADICHFNKKEYFVKPKDFSNLNNLKEIYSGSYCLY